MSVGYDCIKFSKYKIVSVMPLNSVINYVGKIKIATSFIRLFRNMRTTVGYGK